MPTLNNADEVFLGTTLVDRIYKGDVLIWPNVEKWSSWMLVGASGAVAAAPAAWFAASISHYPSGHQRVYWRYSLNTQRVQVKGIATTAIALGYGATVMTLNIDPAIIPRTTMSMMSHGLASTDYVGTWSGFMPRFDMSNNATYHSTLAILAHTSTPLAAGSWFHLETTWAYGDDR